MSHIVLMFAAVLAFASPVQGGTVFNFDSGSVGTTLHTVPAFTQTVGDITATFSGDFSVQNTCQGLCPANLTGNFLFPDTLTGPKWVLTISFVQPLTGISFDFATPDFTLNANTTLQLTAYDSNSTLVGSTSSLAAGEGWGLGFLNYSPISATFNKVVIVTIPTVSLSTPDTGAPNFLASNFSVTPAASSSTVPEPAGLSMIGLVLIGIARRKYRP